MFEIPAQSQSPIFFESGRGLAETPSDLSAVLMLALKRVKANLGWIRGQNSREEIVDGADADTHSFHPSHINGAGCLAVQ